MKFKDYKQKIQKEEYVIPDVLSKVQNAAYQKSFEPKTAPTGTAKKLYRHLTLKICVGVLALFIVSTLAIVGISKQFSNHVSIEAASIKTVDSSENLEKILLSANKYPAIKRTLGEKIERFFNSFGGCSKKADDMYMDTNGSVDVVQNSSSTPTYNDGNYNVSEGSESEKPDQSDTNNQVEGVNEPDIVKIDDNHIYHYSNQHLYIYEVGTTNRLVKEYEWYQSKCKNAYLQQTNKYLIFYFEDSKATQTTVLIYDKLNEFNLVKTISFDGAIVDSRLIDNTLYMVTKRIITDKKRLPQYSIDQQSSDINFNKISYIVNANNSQYTLISTINLEDDITVDVQTQLGASAWNVVYCNTNRLYLASSIYNGERRVIETTIYMYNLTKTATSLDAFARTDGQIPDQYSMDEYNGYLRIATVNTNHSDPTKYNSIKVFSINQIDESKSMSLVGELNEGLGLSYHTIRAARFNGERANVVTYFQSDPLYDIDLSDPTKPTIISAYEAPGYSQYLHAFNDKIMLGIGYLNTNSDPKLSLYQINDQGISDQIGKDIVLINLVYDYYEDVTSRCDITYAFEKPRELLCINDKMLIGIPVIIDNGFKTQDYWIFEINPTLQTTINLIKIISAEEITNEELYGSAIYEDYRVQRVVYLQDHYFVLLDGIVMVYDNGFNYLESISNI